MDLNEVLQMVNDFVAFKTRNMSKFFKLRNAVDRSTVGEIIRMTFESLMISTFFGTEAFERMWDWLNVYYQARNGTPKEIVDFIGVYLAYSKNSFPELSVEASKILKETSKRYRPKRTTKVIESGVLTSPFQKEQRRFFEHLTSFDKAGAHQYILHLLDAGLKLKDIYQYIFTPTLWEIGYLWQLDKLSVVVEHYASAVTEYIMSDLYGKNVTFSFDGPKIAVACPRNERHAIGARMFADVLELEGFNVDFIGADTPEDELVKYVEENDVELVCLSVTMSTRALEVYETAKTLKGARPNLRIIVGGQAAELFRQIEIPNVDAYSFGSLDDGLNLVRGMVLVKGETDERVV